MTYIACIFCDVSSRDKHLYRKFLPFDLRRCIVPLHLQNQMLGLVSRESYWRHMTRPRLFLCRASGSGSDTLSLPHSMVGWAGAPQGAPVSSMAGKTNSVQSITRKIGLFGGGLKSHTGGCLNGYDP